MQFINNSVNYFLFIKYAIMLSPPEKRKHSIEIAKRIWKYFVDYSNRNWITAINYFDKEDAELFLKIFNSLEKFDNAKYL